MDFLGVYAAKSSTLVERCNFCPRLASTRTGEDVEARQTEDIVQKRFHGQTTNGRMQYRRLARSFDRVLLTLVVQLVLQSFGSGCGGDVFEA